MQGIGSDTVGVKPALQLHMSTGCVNVHRVNKHTFCLTRDYTCKYLLHAT